MENILNIFFYKKKLYMIYIKQNIFCTFVLLNLICILFLAYKYFYNIENDI